MRSPPRFARACTSHFSWRHSVPKKGASTRRAALGVGNACSPSAGSAGMHTMHSMLQLLPTAACRVPASSLRKASSTSPFSACPWQASRLIFATVLEETFRCVCNLPFAQLCRICATWHNSCADAPCATVDANVRTISEQKLCRALCWRYLCVQHERGELGWRQVSSHFSYPKIRSLGKST